MSGADACFEFASRGLPDFVMEVEATCIMPIREGANCHQGQFAQKWKYDELRNGFIQAFMP